MTIHQKYTNTLTRYQDSIPQLTSDNYVPNADLIRKYEYALQITDRAYKAAIQKDQIPSEGTLNNIELIKRLTSFYNICTSSLPALLDPPLRSLSDNLRPVTEALLDKTYRVNSSHRTRFFSIRELFYSTITSDAIENAKTLLKAHEILKYSLSQKIVPIPQLTKELALKVLSGEKKPFYKFQILKKLGQGSYGQVSLVQTSNQKKYALKEEFKSDLPSVFDIEYQCLVMLSNHKHVIKIFHVDKSRKLFFLEFAENGHLTTDLEPSIILKALQQISSTLFYLHSQLGLIHSDVKTPNILMDDNFNIKLADFGLAFFKDKYDPQRLEIIPYYLPPELFHGTLEKSECEKIDVWSFGILIWTFLKKDTILSPINSLDTLMPRPDYWDKSFRGFLKGELKKQLDPQKIQSLDPTGWLVHTMESCLDITPKARPTMEEITNVLAELDLS